MSDSLARFIWMAKRRLRVFGANKWGSPYWNIKEGLRNKSSVVSKRHMLLWFSSEIPARYGNSLAERARHAKPMPLAFVDFARAVVVTYFAERPEIGYGSVYDLLAALKSILSALSGSPSPRSITLNHFLIAEGEWIRKWDQEEVSHATARSKGEVLQVLSNILDGWGVLPRKIGFKTKIPLQRREEVDRHSEPFAKRRKRLFPEPEVFYFLAELANRTDLEVRWRLPLRAVEIQIALGKRVSEVLLLPQKPIVEGENGAIGLRYFPEKNADPFVAWVPRDQHFETACAVIRRAVADIEAMTQSARERALELEKCSRWQDYPLQEYKQSEWKSAYPMRRFGAGGPNDWMIVTEWGDAFRTNKLAFGSFMRRFKVPIQVFPPIEHAASLSSGEVRRNRWSSKRKTAGLCTVPFQAVRVNDLKRALFERSREGIEVHAPGGRHFDLSEMLFVVDENWTGRRRQQNGLVGSLAVHHIQQFLTGKDSVFRAFGRPDLSAKSHGFRRWVTTEGRRTGINNLVLARWMGRTFGQNDVYDYNEPKEFSDRELGISTDLTKVFGPVRDVAEDMASRGIPLVERQTFLAAELKGLIVTDKGGCSHEWAITPCKKSRACYNNCPEFYVIKGRQDHYRTALNEQSLIARALELSKTQVGTAYYANGYVQMQENQLRTVREVIRIHEDPSIPDGTLVQVSGKADTVRRDV